MLLLLCAEASFSQVRVVKTAGDKISLDLSGVQLSGPGSVEFMQVLKRNLDLSGWFDLVPQGGSSVRVNGHCRGTASSLQVECKVYRMADQRLYLGKKYRGVASDARRLAQQVSDDIVRAVTGRRGIASSRIVMVGATRSGKELFMCDADGGGLRQLTKNGSVNVSPAWSADGTKLTYTSYMKRFPDVYMLELSSGQQQTLSRYPGLNTGGVIAPDGDSCALILSRDGNPELYVKSLRSGRLTRITRTPRGAEASPDWSPDGNHIVYVSDTAGSPQLYTISRSGGAPSRLRLRGRENVSPDWGPNGLIAYASRYGGQYHIFVVDPKTMRVKQVSSGAGDYEDPSWAPDGRHIVCSRTVHYRSSIYILDTMGDEPVALHTYRGDWYSPAWSPR